MLAPKASRAWLVYLSFLVLLVAWLYQRLFAGGGGDGDAGNGGTAATPIAASADAAAAAAATVQ